MANMKPSTINEYFDGQSVLITGSTGTLGKVLVEKILRCCPGVGRLYLIVREKRNITKEERWKQVTDLPLFDTLKESNPEALNKVTLISGDLRLEEMGMSEEDKQCLLENVTMIYHMASMSQFTDSMSLALINNTKATYMLLNFARRVKKLQLFLYASTAFSNMNIPCSKAIEEVIPATLDWRVVLKLLETQPMMLEVLREKILCGQPNPYTWSKWLSEQIVDEHRIYFPTVIARPAAVCSTIREPLQGWLDTVEGMHAIMQAINFGVLRVLYSKGDSYQDYVPADAAVNSIIVASWKKHIEPAPERTDVYNCCMAKDVRLNANDCKKFGRAIIQEAPSKHIVWPPNVMITDNELLYKILFILFQSIPATLVDLFDYIRNKKPRAVEMTIKLANTLRIYKKFSARRLGFPNDKYKALNDVIPEDEWNTFNTVYEGLDNEDIIYLNYEAVKKYYLKEETDEESMVKHKRRYFWLNTINEVIMFCVWMAGILLLSKVVANRLPE